MRVVFKDSLALLHLASSGKNLGLSLKHTRRASTKGPLLIVLSSSMFVLVTFSFALAVISTALRRLSSASCKTSIGLSASNGAFTKASTAATALSVSAVAFSTNSLASAIMALAAELSAASARRFFSASRSSEQAFLASPTFRFIVPCAVCALLARTRIFMRSALASLMGATPLILFSSSDFCFKKVCVSFTHSIVSCKATSTRREQAENGE
mmetsp:Transcript_73033/g.156433  ORF Transcript_73033/g.156433 Transcript_73033/m.156433 type:complete len:212 (+) Transcript_73033:470-1105(+)